MDKESIYRLGLERIKNIDVTETTEMYNPTTCNHTILVKLKKAEFCKNCGLRKTFNDEPQCCRLGQTSAGVIIKPT